MIMFEKYQEGIKRLKFIMNHKDRFETPWIPILICFAKLFLDVSVGLLQYLFIFFTTSFFYLVSVFVAFTYISELDRGFYHTQNDPIFH